jgi:GAF domain-containing protein
MYTPHVPLFPALSDADSLRKQLAELRRDQQRSGEREAAIRDVIQTIARTTFNLDAVLQTVIDRAVELCDADNGNIARHEGDVYRVVAFTSFTPEYERLVRERIYVPERGSVIGRTLLERQVVHILDVLDDPEYTLTDIQRAGGFRTALGVPMLREGELIGAIAVGRREVRAFDDAEIRLIETFAVIAARSARCSAISGVSPHLPRPLSQRRCSLCCASTTMPWAGWSQPTTARSSTSPATG